MMRRRTLASLLLPFALVAGACGGSGDDTESGTGGGGGGEGTCAEFSGNEEITIGGTNFSEQEIVAEMYAQCLEAAGYKVEKKLKLGAREVVLPALENGDIDLYPEYVGTLLTFLNGTPTPDLDQSITALKEKLAAKNLTVLDASKAEDKNGFAVTKATADKLKVKSLSDLKTAAPTLVFGGPPECPTRPLCLKGLEDTYGLKFKEVKQLDAGGPLTKDALEKGQIDVGLIFTSDGAVAARGFVILEDDKGLQPAENVLPAVREEVAESDLVDALNAISAKLTTEDLSELNKAVDVDKEDPADVAKAWLEENGFI